MIKVKISEIEVKKLELMMVWEDHKIITRNLDNILEDFDFMNQNVSYEVQEMNDEMRTSLANEKMKYLNAHICGILTCLTPDSNFNRKHVLDNGDTVEEANKKKESEDFAKSLQL
ncbi:MAG: hypothetical protein HRU18_01405 [Pseudoalteromonas sp.]|uniref:hypothetical protein n=1 Tax=Pseudoalteromonas sp. TaxID=53249 RepID=UPI001DA8D997|nr:hypothetical protein [Pseudoalteromonas sp.]NRA76837.1 hypothetical protein [Pseudoalteromonas sp.]